MVCDVEMHHKHETPVRTEDVQWTNTKENTKTQAAESVRFGVEHIAEKLRVARLR